MSFEKIDKVFEFDAAGIEEVQIKTVSTSVKTIAQEKPVIKVHLYGKVAKGLLAEEIAEVQGNRLIFRVKPKKRFGFLVCDWKTALTCSLFFISPQVMHIISILKLLPVSWMQQICH